MASEVGSSLVLFIAVIAIAGLAAAGLSKAVGSMAVELDQRGQSLADAIGTDIAIVNDPENVPYSSNTLTVYVKNTGSRTLISEDLALLVDGQYEEFDARQLDGTDSWSQGTVLEANVTIGLGSGDHRVRALYTPNVNDDLEFRVS
jgi:flagellar protein FlaG